ncbi:MAG: hypothetical protein EXQ67_06175 [Thermoleophilia bacterium]|nr:hypothetical protein [Thermoleophilia bacterium]
MARVVPPVPSPAEYTVVALVGLSGVCSLRFARSDRCPNCPIEDQANDYSHDVTFPTDCIRKNRQIGDAPMGVAAGGVAETIIVDAVAFPPSK